MDKSQFEFTNPVLEECKFVVNKDFTNEEYKGLKINHTTEIVNKHETEARVNLKIQIGGLDKGDPFDIVIVMGANYRWDKMDDKSKVDELLNINAPALLLSYARPIVASLTSQAGMPALHIPFMNFMNEQL